jgi:hypothetical protein
MYELSTGARYRVFMYIFMNGEWDNGLIRVEAFYQLSKT